MTSRPENRKTAGKPIRFNPKAGNAERFLAMPYSKPESHPVLRSLKLVPFAIALATLSLMVGLSPRALSQATSGDQKPATSAPDVLTLANGDQLTGKLLSEANGTVTFHSDMAGDLTFTWDKINQYARPRSSRLFSKGNTSHTRLLLLTYLRVPWLSRTGRSR